MSITEYQLIVPQENFNRLGASGSCCATWNVLSDDSEGSLIQTFSATVVLD